MELWGIDVSNYTEPLTPEQVAWCESNLQFVIIGLQSASRARAFQAQFKNLYRMYYLERPSRDLTVPEPGSFVWLDVEEGCLISRAELDIAISRCDAMGLGHGVYGNETSIVPQLGKTSDYAYLPLWWANYGTPDLGRFRPFNGWLGPAIMQYSSSGVQGINCDLNYAIVGDGFYDSPFQALLPPPPPPPEFDDPHFVSFERKDYLSDGQVWISTGSYDAPPR